jgi:hypothetical protein
MPPRRTRADGQPDETGDGGSDRDERVVSQAVHEFSAAGPGKGRAVPGQFVNRRIRTLRIKPKPASVATIDDPP